MRSEDVIISKILEEPEKLITLLDAGIKPDFFIERRNMYVFLTSHYQRYSKVPSVELFKDNFPSWESIQTTDRFEYWIDKLREDKSLILQAAAVEKWLEAKKKDASSEVLSSIFTQVSREILELTSTTNDISLKNIELEKRDYSNKQTDDSLRGIRLGLNQIDIQTGGARGGDLGTIMGPPENMKTWLICMMAHHAWAKEDEPILFISKEMNEKDIRDRLSWFDLKFNFTAFERGMLGRELEQEYFSGLAEREKRQEFIISAEEGEMDKGGGVSVISAKIDRYKPTIVFIDGGYLISDDRGAKNWEATKNVFRDLKRLARVRNIPIIVTTQPQRLKDPKTGEAVKRKLTMEDVGMAWTIAQDSDYMIGVRKIAPDILNIYKIKGRRGKTFDFQLLIDLDNGELKELGSEEEILIEDDSSGDLIYD